MMTQTLWEVLGDAYLTFRTCDDCDQEYLTIRPNDDYYAPPICLCKECNGGVAI
jgi:predicted SprT family Zn-dependent metalloprotease